VIIADVWQNTLLLVLLSIVGLQSVPQPGFRLTHPAMPSNWATARGQAECANPIAP
jgi:hypothetical protein